MPVDPIVQLARIARDLALTPAQVHASAQRLEEDLPTLGSALDRIKADHADQVARIAQQYPQGFHALMDGQPAGHGQPSVRGFGDRPYTELTTANVEPERDRYQHLVAARNRDHGKGPEAGQGPRDGAGAARQLVYAARRVGRLLVDNGFLATFPLDGLKAPPGPGPARDKALTVPELRDYCLVIMANSSDPKLAALVWMLFRVFGARLVELCRLREADLNPARPSITLVGKGGPLRERPIHRQLALALQATMAGRPPAPEGQLLRNVRGTPFSAKTVEGWSRALHKHARWAEPYPLRVHALRHSTVRLIEGKGLDKSDAGFWIGHAPPKGTQSTDIYATDSTGQGRWDRGKKIAETAFGDLDGWPVLPENDILAAALETDLPLPAKTDPSRRRGKHPQKRGKYPRKSD